MLGVVVVLGIGRVAFHALCRVALGVFHLGWFGHLMDEIADLHGNACTRFAGCGVDLVFELEFRHRNGFGSSATRALHIFAALPLRATAPTPAPAPAPTAPSVRGLVLGGLFGRGAALLLGLSRKKGLAVGDRDLIIVGMNFGKSQETVPVAPVIDKGRLQ